MTWVSHAMQMDTTDEFSLQYCHGLSAEICLCLVCINGVFGVILPAKTSSLQQCAQRGTTSAVQWSGLCALGHLLALQARPGCVSLRHPLFKPGKLKSEPVLYHGLLLHSIAGGSQPQSAETSYCVI